MKKRDSSSDVSENDDFEVVHRPKRQCSDKGNEEEYHDEKPELPVGSVSEVKNMYQNARDEHGNFTWVREYPGHVKDPGENAATDTYAILVRNIRSPYGRNKLQPHSIVIQSHWLEKALCEHVLKDYPGVIYELGRLTFEASFIPFLHR